MSGILHLLSHTLLPFAKRSEFCLQVSPGLILNIFIFNCFTGSRLDYCGISLLIAGSMVPCLYYAFYCSLFAQIFYSLLTLILCGAAVTVSMFDKFSDSQFRYVRAIVFASYAFSSLIPSIHWVLMHASQLVHIVTIFKTALIFLGLMALFYTLGVIVYALRIPERFYPGKFDFYVSDPCVFAYFHFEFKLKNNFFLLSFLVSFTSIISHFSNNGRCLPFTNDYQYGSNSTISYAIYMSSLVKLIAKKKFQFIH